MNIEQTALVIQRLDQIHNDVTYLREKQDYVREQVADIKVDISNIKGERASTRWTVSILLPIITALVTTSIALAYAL